MPDSQIDQSIQSRESAHSVVERIFGGVRPGIRYRLWDGSEQTIGNPDGTWTLVLRNRERFREAFRTGNTSALAEAFVDNTIDVEGDLFAALRIANQLENLRLGLRDKLKILVELRRV